MPVTLEQFVEKISGFRSLPEPAKVKYFTWYRHQALGKDRVATGDIGECYAALHLNKPNISNILVRLNEKSPRELLKDSKGFFLEGSVRAAIDQQYLALVKEQIVEVDDHILPDQIMVGTKPYLEKLAWQINGCYQYQFYDGAAVLMRRLIESLLIEVFIKVGHVDKIRPNNEFMMLNGIITVAKQNKYFLLARGTDDILEAIKYLGDRSAHNRSYIASQNDVRDLIQRFRTLISELMNLAGIHKTS